MHKAMLFLAVMGFVAFALQSGCRSDQETSWEDLYDWGADLAAAGQYSEATKLLEESLQIAERTLGDNHSDVATLMNRLALIYCNQGRYAEAEPLFQRSLAIREKVLGPDHPDIAQSLNNFAELLKKTNREDEAVEMEARAEAIRAKAR